MRTPLPTSRTGPAPASASAPAADVPTVLHVIPALRRGGAETMLLRVQARIQRRGRYAPLICAFKGGGPLRDAFETAGLPVVVLNLPRRSLYAPPAFAYDAARALAGIRRIIRERGVCLLQAHLPDADLLALAAGRMAGLPVVVTQQSSALLPPNRGPGPRRALRRWLMRRYYPRASALVGVSPAVVTTLVAEARVPAAKVAMIPNAVDVVGRAPTAARADARARIGVDETEYVVFCTARLVAAKGQAYLIDALGCLPAEVGPVHAVFVGEGEEGFRLAARAAAVPRPHRVSFLGARADAEALLAAADLFCLPSLGEGHSLALLEALAHEVPVLATDVPGIRDTICNGRHGLLVPPRDARALALGCARLYRDRALADACAEAGRALVAERYTVDAAAQRTEALYARVLGGESNS